MPGGVSPELAANLLDTALSSGDETVILGALGSLTSVPVAARNWIRCITTFCCSLKMHVTVPSSKLTQTLKIAFS